MNPVGWVGVELQLVTEQPPHFGHQAPNLSFFPREYHVQHELRQVHWQLGRMTQQEFEQTFLLLSKTCFYNVLLSKQDCCSNIMDAKQGFC